jgi:hypothetical protein
MVRAEGFHDGVQVGLPFCIHDYSGKLVQQVFGALCVSCARQRHSNPRKEPAKVPTGDRIQWIVKEHRLLNRDVMHVNLAMSCSSPRRWKGGHHK